MVTYKHSLELFRSVRANTLALVSDLTQAQLDYTAASGKWSVGEVLDHLILGQRLNLSCIAEVIGMKEAGHRPVLQLSFEDIDVSIGHVPKSMLPALEVPFKILNRVFPDSARDFMTRYRVVPAQNPELTAPRRCRPVDELRDELVSSLKETEVLLESHSHLDYSEMIVQHPLLGNHNVPGLLRFLALHEQRHQSQINDILKNPGFPAKENQGETQEER